ncbi:MAG: toxin-antitoxin system YwqK family antitoxin [Bacteroidia bacterium]|nr:toxin-antitoxin system YwqK family antitoxin [Bacteroidia bacterium]
MKISFIILLMTCLHYLAVCQLSDTINKVDANNMKQGYWIKFDNTKTIKVEEGKFVDDKKEGIWITYYADGKIKSEITYVKGKPDGYARIYYQNGNLSEEGDWKGTKWVGNYKFYYENGSTQYEWSYNNTGKRTGEQKYYHDNGNLMITGEWIDGKENGVIKEYNEKGVLIAEKSFNNGTLDPASVKDYEHQNITDKNNSKDNADMLPIKNRKIPL